MKAGRDTGREHRGVSVLYPDGTQIHRDIHGPDVAHDHFRKLHAEHVIKNHAYCLIIESLPAHMKKPILDSDGDPVLNSAGQPMFLIKNKHKPRFSNLGRGRYEFVVPGIDETTHKNLTTKLTDRFGDSVALLTVASKGYIQ